MAVIFDHKSDFKDMMLIWPQSIRNQHMQFAEFGNDNKIKFLLNLMEKENAI